MSLSFLVFLMSPHLLIHLSLIRNSSVAGYYKGSVTCCFYPLEGLFIVCSSRKCPYPPHERKQPPPSPLTWEFQLSFIHFYNFFWSNLSYRPIKTPWEIPVPSLGGVWIFSGPAQFYIIFMIIMILIFCRYPALQNNQTQFYSQEQVRSLVLYAADRGIRVIPEVESA